MWDSLPPCHMTRMQGTGQNHQDVARKIKKDLYYSITAFLFMQSSFIAEPCVHVPSYFCGQLLRSVNCPNK